MMTKKKKKRRKKKIETCPDFECDNQRRQKMMMKRETYSECDNRR